MAESLESVLGIGSWVIQAFIGGTVGVGMMILLLAKWGTRFFGGKVHTESIGLIAPTCPYASDHPKLQEFMGASLQDRADMRSFLQDINNKVQGVSADTQAMRGKLDLLLLGARVRWNSGLIPPDDKK